MCFRYGFAKLWPWAGCNTHKTSNRSQCFTIVKHFYILSLVKVITLRECQLTYMLLVKLAGGKQGQWTNARVPLLIYWWVGLEFQYVGPTLASTLASGEVPILDIWQEWEVRNAKTRRSGWIFCQGSIQGTSWKEMNLRNLAWISVATKGPWVFLADDFRSI